MTIWRIKYVNQAQSVVTFWFNLVINVSISLKITSQCRWINFRYWNFQIILKWESGSLKVRKSQKNFFLSSNMYSKKPMKIFYFRPLVGQKSWNNFVGCLEYLKTRKNSSEISWPLTYWEIAAFPRPDIDAKSCRVNY